MLGQWKGKRVLVLGMARSGVAAARLLVKAGAQVIVNDGKPEEEVAEDASALRALGIEVVTGGHPLTLLDRDMDVVIKNPGIRYDRPIVLRALERGIPIWTEIELAYRAARGPIIGITGSNGKTTTTTLVGRILSAAGISSEVAGNIGTPLSQAAPEAAEGATLVAELSSFQLMGTEMFRPHIAAILNLYPAHLDYHGTIEAYRDAKWRIFARQEESDYAVLNADQPELWERRHLLASRVLGVSLREPVQDGAYLHDETLLLSVDGITVKLCTVSELTLKGEHNVHNALFASLISYLAGASPAAVRDVLRTFEGVEHRQERVRIVDDALYINDSKATNQEAALRALTSYSSPIVWIAGGLDRGDDVSPMGKTIRGRVRAVIALGQSADKFVALARDVGIDDVRKVATLPEAVAQARLAAHPGDIVLLSPACASWDMFDNFEQRGDMFKQAVHSL